MVVEITPSAVENLEFYGRRLAVGDRITMCPDVVCGRCYECTHVMGYVWCEHSRCYGNSFTSAEPPHLLGGMSELMYLRPDTFVYKVPDGLSLRVAVLAELMACTASLDKVKEFSSYALEGFNSGDTVVVIGSGPLGHAHQHEPREHEGRRRPVTPRPDAVRPDDGGTASWVTCRPPDSRCEVSASGRPAPAPR